MTPRQKAPRLDPSLLDVAGDAPPIEPAPVLKARKRAPSTFPRAKEHVAAAYSKQMTLMLNEERYKRLKRLMLDNNRLAQELLTELTDKWCDRMEKRAAKAQLNGGMFSPEDEDDRGE